MIVIMVHWLIKRGAKNTKAFEAMWKRMSIHPNAGLYREILTKPVQADDPKFNTFSLTDRAYVTYLNIGIWKNVASFDAAVGKYIQSPERRKPLKGSYKRKRMLAVYQHNFEFKIRERIILKKLWDRKGAASFPKSDLL